MLGKEGGCKSGDRSGSWGCCGGGCQGGVSGLFILFGAWLLGEYVEWKNGGKGGGRGGGLSVMDVTIGVGVSVGDGSAGNRDQPFTD